MPLEASRSPSGNPQRAKKSTALPQATPAGGISQSVAGEQKRKESKAAPPPGDFVSDDQRTQTANFLDELRKRLKRKTSAAEPKLGPPKRRR
jgi:hypothetical protein